ncbi:sulfatase-like hydrolase/transferase [Arenibacter sp. ARW7G5Y1]|uniref:sulfatase-like hydrolase/transferase n=1 Tax=Arenibacter sp. ARW7G5Y1 TaxID=2135619 RepID=UPI000D76A7D2|nr:sulfatase-like hydrolase/transferase [Arenibacter sp. ARW7G5Y1]PXX22864.1 arylsulfatase A-like enzyme [Arenibacter sp. ARW7G5Y1]
MINIITSHINSFSLLFFKRFFTVVTVFYIITVFSVNIGCYAQTGVAKTIVDQLNSRPNILLLYADDQGTSDIRDFGAKDLQTPNLDRLAAKGVKFTQAYAHSVCCPSRAALLTGRAPQRSGVNDWTSSHPNDYKARAMNLNETTLAEYLKQYDYNTGIIGKWHLGATDNHNPLKHGFDYFFGFRGGFIDYYTHQYLHSERQKPPFHDLYRNNSKIHENGKYFPDLQLKEVYKYLEENKHSPFFLYVPFNLPHYPEQPDSTFVKQYEHLKWPRSSYASMISTLDDRIGKILTKLDQLGLAENTIIIYMSDNGHSTEDYFNWGISYGSNGGGGYTGKWRGAKASFLEGGIRVPAIISFPKKIPQNVTRDQVVSNMDIFPTLCDLLQIPLPVNELDGKSILPVINSDIEPSPHEVMHWQWQSSWAVRKGNWKLIFNGRDTTGKFSNHPIKDSKMPDYYLAKLDDLNPEEINYAIKYPSIVEDLEHLHQIWSVEVFRDSGYPDPNKK